MTQVAPVPRRKRVAKDFVRRLLNRRIKLVLEYIWLRAILLNSRKGNCYDYAPVESFWDTLKTELVHYRRYQTHALATQRRVPCASIMQ
jgi:transposase InsO family protein